MKKQIILFLLIIIISGCSNEEIQEENHTENFTQEINNTVNETIDNQTTNETIDNQTIKNVIQTCLDTDGGKIYDKKGTTVVEGKKFSTAYDYCENTGRLIEYYCKDDNTRGVEIYTCAGSVCIEGLCGELNTTVVNETNST